MVTETFKMNFECVYNHLQHHDMHIQTMIMIKQYFSLGSLYTSSSSLSCITAWESSSFWHWLLHWHMSVQAKSLALQEHLPEEQSDLHLHWTTQWWPLGLGGPLWLLVSACHPSVWSTHFAGDPAVDPAEQWLPVPIPLFGHGLSRCAASELQVLEGACHFLPYVCRTDAIAGQEWSWCFYPRVRKLHIQRTPVLTAFLP